MHTQDVLNHHLQAFGAGDVAETLKDFTEESVLITPSATLRGLSELRKFFADGYNGIFRPGTYEFTMNRVEVVGDVAFIAWRLSGETAEISLGTDTFLVRDGKIAVQTFAVNVEPK